MASTSITTKSLWHSMPNLKRVDVPEDHEGEAEDDEEVFSRHEDDGNDNAEKVATTRWKSLEVMERHEARDERRGSDSVNFEYRSLIISACMLSLGMHAVTRLLPCLILPLSSSSMLLASMYGSAMLSVLFLGMERLLTSTMTLAIASSMALIVFLGLQLLVTTPAHLNDMLLVMVNAFMGVALAGSQLAQMTWVITMTSRDDSHRASPIVSHFLTARDGVSTVLGGTVLSLTLSVTHGIQDDSSTLTSRTSIDSNAMATLLGLGMIALGSATVIQILVKWTSTENGGSGTSHVEAVEVRRDAEAGHLDATNNVLNIARMAWFGKGSLCCARDMLISDRGRDHSHGRQESESCDNLVCLGLLLPNLFHAASREGAMNVIFLKESVFDVLGLEHVGPMLIVQGVAQCIGSAMTGQAIRFFDRRRIRLLSFLLEASLMVEMYLWQPSRDDPLHFYALAFIWGISSGLWDFTTLELSTSQFGKRRDDGMMRWFVSALTFAKMLGFVVVLAFVLFRECKGFEGSSQFLVFVMMAAFAIPVASSLLCVLCRRAYGNRGALIGLNDTTVARSSTADTLDTQSFDVRILEAVTAKLWHSVHC